MQRLIFKSKIHRATLTGKSLEYEGSIAVDKTLLKLADILPGEQVHVLNLNNGVRLITYAIPAPAGSGTMLLNGPAARLGEPGDLIVLLTYTWMATAEAKQYKPTVIRVDAKNEPLPKTAVKKKENGRL